MSLFNSKKSSFAEHYDVTVTPVIAKSLFCEVTVTIDHQNVISSLSSSEQVSQIWRNSPKEFRDIMFVRMGQTSGWTAQQKLQCLTERKKRPLCIQELRSDSKLAETQATVAWIVPHLLSTHLQHALRFYWIVKQAFNQQTALWLTALLFVPRGVIFS